MVPSVGSDFPRHPHRRSTEAANRSKVGALRPWHQGLLTTQSRRLTASPRQLLRTPSRQSGRCGRLFTSIPGMENRDARCAHRLALPNQKSGPPVLHRVRSSTMKALATSVWHPTLQAFESHPELAALG